MDSLNRSGNMALLGSLGSGVGRGAVGSQTHFPCLQYWNEITRKAHASSNF